jgi:hypothetical protein
MRKALVGMTMLALLGGCELKVRDDARDGAKDGDASVSIGADGNVAISENGLSIKTPGFAGKIDIAGMKLGGDTMEVAGMKLYPGTELVAINVVDKAGPDNGLVDMRFTSPAAPDKVAAYYAQASRDAGFRDIAVRKQGDKALFSAIKEDSDRVTIEIAPAAKGSAGHIRVQDGE